KFSVRVHVLFSGDVSNPAVGVMLKTPQGQALQGVHSYHDNRLNLGPKRPGDRLSMTLESVMHLNPGKYIMNVGIADHETDREYKNIDSRHNVAVLTIIGKEFSY